MTTTSDRFGMIRPPAYRVTVAQEVRHSLLCASGFAYGQPRECDCQPRTVTVTTRDHLPRH